MIPYPKLIEPIAENNLNLAAVETILKCFMQQRIILPAKAQKSAVEYPQRILSIPRTLHFCFFAETEAPIATFCIKSAYPVNDFS